MSRRGEKRRRSDFKSAAEKDGQRRRSPRLTSSSLGEDDAHDSGSQPCTVSDQSIERKFEQPPMPPQPRPPCNEQGNVAPRLHKDTLNSKLSASQLKDSEKQEHQDDESWIPEKRILELVLDTLQRRDTHDIFAEPVDPSEVEEYYEIITEPMDFGTMRAKLHEGMYKTLQQFEHDMYLIFDNAMYFNSSGTVYYRQARALEDLAKKVFIVLKTDPANFELEFSATRRRSSRKLDGEPEPRGSISASGQKLARDLGSNGMSTDIDQKGCRRRKRPDVSSIDRRCTYNPWKSEFDETDSSSSPINPDTNPLIHVNQDYRKSLMLFLRHLGPTAHRVAERKLQGLLMQNANNSDSTTNNNCQIPTASSRLQMDLNKSLCRSIPSTTSISRHFTDSMNLHSIQEKTDLSMIKDGKLVKTFPSSSSLLDANESANLRKSDPDLRDQAKVNNRNGTIVMGLLASRDGIHRNTSVRQRCAGVITGSELIAVPKDDHLLNSQTKAVLPPTAKESKHSHAGMFDLNQVQVQASSSSSHLGSHFRDDSLRPTPFGLLPASKLSHVPNPELAQHMPPLLSSRQFMFNVPFLESRLNGGTGFNPSTSVGNTMFPTAALQLGSEHSWPFSSHMSFGQASNSQEYMTRNEYLDNHHPPSPFQKNRLLTFEL